MTDSIVLIVIAILVALDFVLGVCDSLRAKDEAEDADIARIVAFHETQKHTSLLSQQVSLLSKILGKEGELLAELDDLIKAVADLQTAAAAEITTLQNIAAQLKALTGQATINPAAVEAAAVAIEAVATSLTAATASVTPAAPAAPAVPAV